MPLSVERGQGNPERCFSRKLFWARIERLNFFWKPIACTLTASYRVARNFRGSLISRIDDFVRFAGRNFSRIWISDFTVGNKFSRILAWTSYFLWLFVLIFVSRITVYFLPDARSTKPKSQNDNLNLGKLFDVWARLFERWITLSTG